MLKKEIYKVAPACLCGRGVHGSGLSFRGGRSAVESRGSTTPPALNLANYLTIRALTYAVTIVCRPPACFCGRGVTGLRSVF